MWCNRRYRLLLYIAVLVLAVYVVFPSVPLQNGGEGMYAQAASSFAAANG